MTIHNPDIPSEAPIIVLPSALLFPNALMPFYIFEQRYRAMLNWALVHDRAFCIALRKPGISDAEGPDDFFHTAGLGLVRACVTNKDGTSHLMLQGLSRVRFVSFIQRAPFYIAKLVPIPTEPSPDSDTEPLAAELRSMCKRFRAQGLTDNIEAFLLKMKDPDLLADAVAHSFVHDPLTRQQILEEPRLRERLEMIIQAVETETPQGKND